jgi:hypothetical protein
MYGIYLVDDIPQKVAVLHPILDAAEHRRNYVAAIAAVRALEAAEICKEARPPRTIGTHRFVIVDEGNELVPSDPALLSCPIAPAVGRRDRRLERHALELGVGLARPFQVVEEFQKHDPGKHGQAIEIAIQPFVLAHDIARRLDDAAELLRRRLRLCNFLLFSECHSAHSLPISRVQACL